MRKVVGKRKGEMQQRGTGQEKGRRWILHDISGFMVLSTNVYKIRVQKRDFCIHLLLKTYYKCINIAHVRFINKTCCAAGAEIQKSNTGRDALYLFSAVQYDLQRNEEDNMMKVYICPECGWMRVVSRRKQVECYKCGQWQMSSVKLDFLKYTEMNEEERKNYAEGWLYIHNKNCRVGSLKK